MLNVRNAGLDDVSAICNVLASSWKAAYRGIVHDAYLDSLSSSHWTDFLIDGIKNRTISVRVLEDEGSVIGSAVLCEEEKDVHLVSFYLLPDKTGSGLGSFFYNEVEKELRRKGFTKCVLDVLQDNCRAVRFYLSRGFCDTNKQISAKLGETEYVCSVFEKML